MFNLTHIVGGLIKLLGGTDKTPIGNVLDALKVNLRKANGNEAGTPSDPIFVDFPDNANRTQLNPYGEALSVPTSVTTSIISYTVPAGKQAILERASGSGENVATYTLKVNMATLEVRRTYFGADLTTDFDFISKANLGYLLVAGDTVTLEVIHNRPTSGNFEGKLQIIELN